MQRFFKPSEFHLLQDAEYHDQKVLVTLNDKPDTWHYMMNRIGAQQEYTAGMRVEAVLKVWTKRDIELYAKNHEARKNTISVFVDFETPFIFNVLDASLIELIE